MHHQASMPRRGDMPRQVSTVLLLRLALLAQHPDRTTSCDYPYMCLGSAGDCANSVSHQRALINLDTGCCRDNFGCPDSCDCQPLNGSPDTCVISGALNTPDRACSCGTCPGPVTVSCEVRLIPFHKTHVHSCGDLAPSDEKAPPFRGHSASGAPVVRTASKRKRTPSRSRRAAAAPPARTTTATCSPGTATICRARSIRSTASATGATGSRPSARRAVRQAAGRAARTS